MKRYIDADKLIKDGWSLQRTKHSLTSNTYEVMGLDRVPTVDVRENIKAMYIFDTHYGEWRCSNCGIVFEGYADEPPYNFCPNCGADMRGK